ncbi:hypothetical protein [Aneurinibacillus migulanus]|nr:hypothetical protein [Aneurinibacillus migulanus]
MKDSKNTDLIGVTKNRGINSLCELIKLSAKNFAFREFFAAKILSIG